MEDKTKQVVSLPLNTIKPMQGRIFCVEVDPGQVKASKKIDLIMPTSIFGHKKTAVGPEEVEIKYKRYIVIDVADDVLIEHLHVEPDNKRGRKRRLERGDEVIPFLPDVIGFDFPDVIDWGVGTKYKMFHYTEIAGTSCIIPKLIEGD